MTPRDLLTLALRFMGLWFVFEVIRDLAHAMASLAYVVSSGQLSALPPYFAFSTLFGPLSTFIIGIVAIVFAPAISARLYRAGPSGAEEPRLQVQIVDVYRILSFLLGIYVLLQAVQPAVLALAQVAQGGSNSFLWIVGFIQAPIYLCCGGLLIFGSQSLARVLSRVHYDPDRVASPQFSLRLALVVVFGCAVVFGLVRFLATWP